MLRSGVVRFAEIPMTSKKLDEVEIFAPKSNGFRPSKRIKVSYQSSVLGPGQLQAEDTQTIVLPAEPDQGLAGRMLPVSWSSQRFPRFPEMGKS